MWAPSIDSPWNHLNSSNVISSFKVSPHLKWLFPHNPKISSLWFPHPTPTLPAYFLLILPNIFKGCSCLLCKCGWVAKYLSSKSVLRLQMTGRSTGYRGETLLPGSCTFSFQILHLSPWLAPNWRQVLMPCSSLWCLSPLQFFMLF